MGFYNILLHSYSCCGDQENENLLVSASMIFILEIGKVDVQFARTYYSGQIQLLSIYTFLLIFFPAAFIRMYR